jgi:DNA-directed RNA polymerase subunit RPC12/RpoP
MTQKDLLCPTCGRSLKILWPTRTIICACGARVLPLAKLVADASDRQQP